MIDAPLRKPLGYGMIDGIITAMLECGHLVFVDPRSKDGELLPCCHCQIGMPTCPVEMMDGTIHRMKEAQP